MRRQIAIDKGKEMERKEETKSGRECKNGKHRFNFLHLVIL